MQMAYNIDVPKTSVAEALEILVDSVVNPKFLAWEVKEAVEKMKGDLQTVKDNPQTLLMEAGHHQPHTLTLICVTTGCPRHAWACLGLNKQEPMSDPPEAGILQGSDVC